MKQHAIKYGSYILGLGLLIAVFYWLGVTEIIKSLQIVNWTHLIFYLISSLAVFLGVAWRWGLILKVHGYKINFFKLFNYKMAGFAISYITPAAKLGGEPVRIYFLTKNKVKLEDAISSVFIDKIQRLVVDAFVTIGGIILILLMLSKNSLIKWGTIVSTIILTILLFELFKRFLRGEKTFSSILNVTRLIRLKFFKKHIKRINESERAIGKFYREHRLMSTKTLLISLLLWGVSTIQIKFLLSAFGFNAPIAHIFFVLIVISAAFTIPIPSALGVLELGQVALFNFLGTSINYGLTISIATRIGDIIWTFYGLIFIYLKGGLVKRALNYAYTDKDENNTLIERDKNNKKERDKKQNES